MDQNSFEAMCVQRCACEVSACLIETDDSEIRQAQDMRWIELYEPIKVSLCLC